jgi:zinc protease
LRKILLLTTFALILASLGYAQKATPAKTGKQPVVIAGKPIPKQQENEVRFVNKVLPNGFEVIVLPDSSVPIVTIELVARNGSFTEPIELNGLSHLYEHMFFKPNKGIEIFRCETLKTTGRTAEFEGYDCNTKLKAKAAVGDVKYLEKIDEFGAVNNGTTNEEYVNYYYTTTTDGFPYYMRYMRDAVRFPTFNEDEFEKETQVVIGELQRQESNPFFYLGQVLKDKLWYEFPTRKRPGGTQETVLSATTEKMRTIQSRYYVPNNMALIVTGDVEPEKVYKMAEEMFGDWKRREIEPFKEFPLVDHPPLKKSEGFVVEQPVNNVLIQVGWHGPSVGKDDSATYAADVFSYILGQPDSRFQRALVDSGLATVADISYYTQRNVGPITLTIAASPKNAKQAIRTAHAEIARFNDPDYFTDEELENAKGLLESRDLFEREKLSEYAHTLGFWWSSTGVEYFRGYQKNLRAVSRPDIKRYIDTYILNKPRIGVALVSGENQSQIKLISSDLTGVK